MVTTIAKYVSKKTRGTRKTRLLDSCTQNYYYCIFMPYTQFFMNLPKSLRMNYPASYVIQKHSPLTRNETIVGLVQMSYLRLEYFCGMWRGFGRSISARRDPTGLAIGSKPTPVRYTPLDKAEQNRVYFSSQYLLRMRPYYLEPKVLEPQLICYSFHTSLEMPRNILKRKEPRESDTSDSEEEETAALTTVYCGENPLIDIVAVHGLNGDAFKTFTSKKTGKFWLGDEGMLPKDMPDCRVLTFSYPASVAAVFGRTSSDTILQHATTLVQELAADRQIERATERPIIFLCHSLGGIIVKRALIYSESRKAKKTEHIHSVFVSTYGIMFFGTPHHGSSKAILANYVQRMVDILPSKVVDTDSQLLEALREGSEILQDITDNFQPKMRNFHVFFFWEQQKCNLGVKWDYVVAQTSAAPIMDDTDRAGIKADHRSMCNFATRTSPGYRLVIATLMRYSDEAPSKIELRWAETRDIMRSMRRNEAREIYHESD